MTYKFIKLNFINLIPIRYKDVEVITVDICFIPKLSLS